jgi:hypothetical protein
MNSVSQWDNDRSSSSSTTTTTTTSSSSINSSRTNSLLDAHALCSCHNSHSLDCACPKNVERLHCASWSGTDSLLDPPAHCLPRAHPQSFNSRRSSLWLPCRERQPHCTRSRRGEKEAISVCVHCRATNTHTHTHTHVRAQTRASRPVVSTRGRIAVHAPA